MNLDQLIAGFIGGACIGTIFVAIPLHFIWVAFRSNPKNDDR